METPRTSKEIEVLLRHKVGLAEMPKGACVHCGKESIGRVLFAQAY